MLVSPMERDPSGGPVFQRFLFRPGRAVVRRPLPPKIAGRRPPALHGVGLLASVPADAITALEDPTDRNGDGISGRARRVAGAVGRFGWKARAADLEASVAAALVNEMGLTNTRHGTQPASGPVSPEVSAAQLARLVGFVRLLPAPAPSCGTPVNEAGRRWFDATGCARCHVPSLPAGRSKGTHPVIHAYTDLLLHDVGAELSDGFEDGDTAGAEFRTAPLWGLGRTPPPYLHDGRAATLDAAIRAHAGEALSSRRDYAALTSEARAALRSFLNCL